MKFLKDKLATPRQRLLARVIDAVFQLTPLIALGFMTQKYADIEAQMVISPEVARRAALFVALFGAILIVYIVQWILIASRGQSLGKIIMKIRIVDDEHEKNAGIVRNLVLRTWVNGILISNAVYLIVDSFLIFRKDRKCLHDHLARTKVVQD